MALKKFLGIHLLAALFAAAVAASPVVRDASINGFVSQTCVTASTATWTAIPTTNGGTRTTMFVSNAGTTSAYIGGSSSVAITVPGTILGAGTTQSFKVSGSLQLYAVSLTSADSICVWEVTEQ